MLWVLHWVVRSVGERRWRLGCLACEDYGSMNRGMFQYTDSLLFISFFWGLLAVDPQHPAAT